MMPRKGGARSRSDITSCREERDQDYSTKTDQLKEIKEDVQTERETIEGMDGLGTMEGMEAVTESLREAENVSQEEFSQEGEALNESQSEGKEFEDELQERTDSNSADMTKIEQTRQSVKSEAAGSSVERAAEQTREDIEFLRGEEEQAREAREASEQEYAQLSQIVSGSGS